MAPTQDEQNELISLLCDVSGMEPGQARGLLAAHDWKLEQAINTHFAGDDEAGEMDYNSHEPVPPPTASAAPPAGSGVSHQPKAPKKKFATLRDVSGGDEDDDESESDEMPQDMFAGGEKSGLAVQNPDDLKKKIIEKAKRGVGAQSRDEPKPKKSYFTGSARTLGGDDTPSRIIEDPSANLPKPPERVHRVLHFWADGFSVDDGELFPMSDPKNAQILQGIRQGHAPLSIMNVLPGQEVDVELKPHEEKYVKPKPKYKPFSGSGHRLGSPTPSTSQPAPAPAAPTAAGAAASAAPEQPKIDESQPIVRVQVRLGDGSRLATRFNTTSTVGDVYAFVMAASPISQSRAWVLQTTFPSIELRERDTALGDVAELKKGGVVVQKWV